MVKWHKADVTERLYCNYEGGKKMSMPRYYKDKIYTHNERLDIKAKWSAEMKIKEDEKYYLSPEDQKQLIEAQKNAYQQMHKNNLKLKQKI